VIVLAGNRNPAILRLLERVKAKGIPVHVIGGEKPSQVKPTAPPEPEVRRGLPD
jgi:hypothetical protein